MNPAVAPSPAPPLPTEEFVIGQVIATPHAGGGWRLRHVEDKDVEAELQSYTAPEAAREIATLDEAGAFRALKTAPTLKRGWQIDLADDDALRAALDFLYPAALGFIEHDRRGTLRPVHLRETLGRQTGMYRFTNSIRDDQAQQVLAEVCELDKCLRCITWQVDEGLGITQLSPGKLAPPASSPSGPERLPLFCVEACTHVVSAARVVAQKNHREAEKQAGG